jgi:type II secretory pathway predicted ATPase ExeA
MNYSEYFGFKEEPFTSEVNAKNLLKLPSMVQVKERFDYVLKGGVFVITGEVGSGKSTSLRWTQGHYHPSQHLFINVVASCGSIIELYRQICWGLSIDTNVASRTRLLRQMKEAIGEITQTKKQKIIIIIDEAHLLRPEVFAELHTATQFENDSRNLVSLVLAGLVNLIDKLTYRSSLPLASRVITKTHLSNLNEEQIKIYLEHHQHIIGGIKKQLFTESAISAIAKVGGGVLRRTNHLARGGLIAAATEQENSVTAEHIRIASTELI